MDEWMKKSWYFQQELHHKFKDRSWDSLDDSNILDKIQYSFKICCGSNFMANKDLQCMYDNVIKKVLVQYDGSSKKLFSCTFINSRVESNGNEQIHCVFWAKTGKPGTGVCVDTNGRVYENWMDFIGNNKLPKCQIMYPVGGKYVHNKETTDDYVDIILEESTACSSYNTFRSILDVGANILSATAIVLLTFNPFTAPIAIGAAAAAAVVGGVTSTAFSAGRLYDIHRYEGIDLTSGKSLFAVADVVLSTVGTAAVGVTSGCKVLTTGSRWLSESVAAIKLANGTASVCKVVSGVSSVYCIINTIYMYTTKTLTEVNIKNLGLMLHFMYNITVSTPVAIKLIEYISSCNSLSGIVDNLIRMKDNVFAFSRSVRRFVVSSDLSALLDFLFPFKIIPIVKRFTEMSPLKKAFKIIDNLELHVSKDPISVLYKLLKQMPEIFQEVDNYLNSTQKQLTGKCDAKTIKTIKDWTSQDGIDFCDGNSMFDSKINLPVELQNMVLNAFTILRIETDKRRLSNKESLLVSTILSMVTKHNVKGYTYIKNKTDFYCEKFVNIFRSMTDLLHFHYFRFTVSNGLSKSTKMYFKEELSINCDVVDYVFMESLNVLQECVEDLHGEYEYIYKQSQISEPTDDSKLIFKWQVPNTTTLDEDFFYGIALQHLPNLSAKLGKDVTICEIYFDSLAIITSIKDNFKLLFHFVKDNNNINGLLIQVNA